IPVHKGVVSQGFGEDSHAAGRENPAYFFHRSRYIEVMHDSGADNHIDVLGRQTHCLGIVHSELDILQPSVRGVYSGFTDGHIRYVDADDALGPGSQIEREATCATPILKYASAVRSFIDTPSVQVEAVTDSRIEPPYPPIPL